MEGRDDGPEYVLWWGTFFLWILDCFLDGRTYHDDHAIPLLCFFGFFLFDLGGNVYPSRKRFFLLSLGFTLAVFSSPSWLSSFQHTATR